MSVRNPQGNHSVADDNDIAILLDSPVPCRTASHA